MSLIVAIAFRFARSVYVVSRRKAIFVCAEKPMIAKLGRRRRHLDQLSVSDFEISRRQHGRLVSEGLIGTPVAQGDGKAIIGRLAAVQSGPAKTVDADPIP